MGQTGRPVRTGGGRTRAPHAGRGASWGALPCRRRQCGVGLRRARQHGRRPFSPQSLGRCVRMRARVTLEGAPGGDRAAREGASLVSGLNAPVLAGRVRAGGVSQGGSWGGRHPARPRAGAASTFRLYDRAGPDPRARDSSLSRVRRPTCPCGSARGISLSRSFCCRGRASARVSLSSPSCARVGGLGRFRNRRVRRARPAARHGRRLGEGSGRFPVRKFTDAREYTKLRFVILSYMRQVNVTNERDALFLLSPFVLELCEI